MNTATYSPTSRALSSSPALPSSSPLVAAPNAHPWPSSKPSCPPCTRHKPEIQRRPLPLRPPPHRRGPARHCCAAESFARLPAMHNQHHPVSAASKAPAPTRTPSRPRPQLLRRSSQPRMAASGCRRHPTGRSGWPRRVGPAAPAKPLPPTPAAPAQPA